MKARAPWGLSLARILAVLDASSSVLGCGGNAETSAESSEDPRASGGALSGATGGAPGTATGGMYGTGVGAGPIVMPPGAGGTGGTGPRFPIDPAQFEGIADPELLDALVDYDPAVLGELCTTPEPDAYMWLYQCLELSDPSASCDQVFTLEDAVPLYDCGLQQGADVVCGPALHLLDGASRCCYFVGGDCPVGRPFYVDSRARTALQERRTDWREGLFPDLTGLDAKARQALARLHLESGLGEHASVAAFSRFVLQCLSLGAPADIVEAAVRACQEEVEHAKFAFGLSSHYAGEARGPGPLDISGALCAGGDFESVVLSALREGCIAETVSAHLILAARDAASDPVVKRILRVIFEQEMEHALLAWRFVAWALASGTLSSARLERLKREVEGAFSEAEKSIGWGPSLDKNEENTLPRELLRAHGYIPVSERRNVASGVLQQVIRPAAAALLRGNSTSANAATRAPGFPDAAHR